jgi:hypothetical protein
LATPAYGVEALGLPRAFPSGSVCPSEKIRVLAFVLSNSENISCVGFLKPKIAENRNWRFGILLIG